MRTHWELKNTENCADYKWKIFAVILLVSFFLAVPVEALRLKTNWAERVDLSEKVLRGQVVRVNSYRSFEKNLIYTDVVVLIDEYLKGDGPEEITITLPGGTVGNETQWVSDVPEFDVGDYGVILLESSGHVTGGPDGVYLLQKSAAEDEFLPWIRSYINGQTIVSFEELSNETSAQPMQQETSYATITGISPSAVSAGTGDVITITGSGFGDSCCTGTFGPMILFRYVASSWMGRSLDIVSWSDTEIKTKVWTAIVNSYPYSPGSWDDTVIFVNSSGQKESFHPLTITFGYGFAEWPSPPVSYYVNEAGGPSGTDATIQAAANTWTGAGANFSFNYAGTTANGYANDGLNVISFGNLGSSSIIGRTTLYYSGRVLTQADIQFNTQFNWSTDTPTPGDKMDLQSIALHELGHWLWLLDLYGAYDTAKVMYGYGSYGQMKRTLTSGDQQGIQWIYPSPLTVQFSGASSSGSEATTPASITVTLSAASGQTVTVTYATTDDTATAGSDYTSTSGTLTFNPGVTSQTINVPIINDTAVEGDERFMVTLSSPVNAILGATTTHTYTINNDDNAGTIQFSSGTYNVNENGGSILITVTRTGGSSGAVGVSYTTSNGSATAGSDYTSASGTLSWANGDTSSKTFSVPITNDTLDESNETFTVTLSTPTGGAALGSPSSLTVTITDDDPTPTVQFSGASSSGSEATTPASITVTLSAASGQTVTVNYATADGTATAGSDYTPTSGTLTFNPGVTSQTINVPIINDTAVEGDERFMVTLSSPVNAILGATTTHTYTINNDDNAGTIQFSSGTYSVNENGGSILITVSRTGGSSGAVGVSYATSNGSATAGSDYTSASGTLSWANGDTSNKTFSVSITNDTLDESNETFTVTLSSPTGGAALGSPSSSTVTITDDDLPYLVTLQSPSDGAIFNACSLISKNQPAFTWTMAETFTSCTIFFSTPGGVLINKATVRTTANTWTPSSSVWKKVMSSSSQNGEIYWRVIGTRPNRTTAESESWSFSIGPPQLVTINAPTGGPMPAAIPPTFDFDTNCNVKFKLEISSVGDFSDPKKIKNFNYTTRNPNVDQKLIKALSSFQWNSVKKMVGTGTGYFRIKAWDGINRESVSETRFFTLQ